MQVLSFIFEIKFFLLLRWLLFFHFLVFVWYLKSFVWYFLAKPDSIKNFKSSQKQTVGFAQAEHFLTHSHRKYSLVWHCRQTLWMLCDLLLSAHYCCFFFCLGSSHHFTTLFLLHPCCTSLSLFMSACVCALQRNYVDWLRSLVCVFFPCLAWNLPCPSKITLCT